MQNRENNRASQIEVTSLPGCTFAFSADETKRIVYADEQTMKLYGCSTMDELLKLINGRFEEMIAPEDRADALHSIESQSRIENGNFNHVIYRINSGNANDVVVESFGQFVDSEELGKVYTVISIVLSRSMPLRHLGYSDSLTGLMSMQTFFERIAPLISSNTSESTQSVIYINLRHFKLYNALYGTAKGDELLRDMAHKLCEEFPNDLISRFSFDHFVIFTEVADPTVPLEHVNTWLTQTVKANELQLKAGIRHINPHEQTNPQLVCDEAKVACDAIKTRSDLIYLEYHDALSQQMERIAYVVANLDAALERGDISIYYQPIFRVTTNKIYGFEALSRWIDAKYGSISPSTFVPALEDSHEIDKLDASVIRQVCRDLRERIDNNLPVVPVSFNLSQIDFSKPSKPFSDIEAIVSEFNIPRHYLHIEITESVMMGNEEHTSKQISLLREAGYEVWVDDFGAGYSPIGLLRNNEFDGIKIDSSLLHDLNDRGEKIMAHSVGIAKALNSRTLAEGVETEEQFSLLKNIDCELAQGYYFAHPMLLADYLLYCNEHHIVFESPEEATMFDNIRNLDENSKKPYSVMRLDRTSIKAIFANKVFKAISVESGMCSVVEGANGSTLATSSETLHTIRRLVNAIEKPGEICDWHVGKNGVSKDLHVDIKLLARNGDISVFSVAQHDENSETTWSVKQPMEFASVASQNDLLNNELTDDDEFISRASFDISLNDALAQSLSEEDSDVGIQSFIQAVGETFDADRAYIITENGDKSLTVSYEWLAEGAAEPVSPFQDVNFYNSTLIDRIHNGKRFMVFRNAEDMRNVADWFYENLHEHGVHSAMSVPIKVGGRRIGIFGLDNPSDSILESDGSAVVTIAQFLGIMIRNRDILSHLDYLSMRDDLTGILNRRGLEKYVRSLEYDTLLVLVYADINNLKTVNDNLGHDAGDRLIRECGLLMLDVAGSDHVFRIGGDEFVMTFELSSEDEEEPLRRVREAFEEAGVSIALGFSAARTPISDIEALLSEADKHMYRNKLEMHAAREAN